MPDRKIFDFNALQRVLSDPRYVYALALRDSNTADGFIQIAICLKLIHPETQEEQAFMASSKGTVLRKMLRWARARLRVLYEALGNNPKASSEVESLTKLMEVFFIYRVNLVNLVNARLSVARGNYFLAQFWVVMAIANCGE
jgi:hypothetical protein